MKAQKTPSDKTTTSAAAVEASPKSFKLYLSLVTGYPPRPVGGCPKKEGSLHRTNDRAKTTMTLTNNTLVVSNGTDSVTIPDAVAVLKALETVANASLKPEDGGRHVAVGRVRL